jgi:hypothetical protein
MFTNVEAYLALPRAVMIYNQTARAPSLEHAIAAKRFCTQASFEVASDARRVFGGNGLSKDTESKSLSATLGPASAGVCHVALSGTGFANARSGATHDGGRVPVDRANASSNNLKSSDLPDLWLLPFLCHVGDRPGLSPRSGLLHSSAKRDRPQCFASPDNWRKN